MAYIDKVSIDKLLKTKHFGRKISVFGEIQSTNSFLKNVENPKNGQTVLAEHQTAGRGRQGKSFFSPDGAGLYLSVLIKAENTTPLMLTTLAAVAVAEAIEKVAPIDAKIKWVNDIYVNGKKLCGILAEGIIPPGETAIMYIVLGIGINLRNTRFPDDIQKIATSIERECGKAVDPNLLAAEILNRLESYVYGKNTDEIIEKSRQRSCVLGREIEILSPKGRTKAKAVDLDSEGHLIADVGSELQTLSFGEISVRFE